MGLPSLLGSFKYVPASLARKALEKFDPSFKNYFAKSLSYGIDADRALDYVMQKFEGKGQQGYKQKLEQGAANNTLRPDEAVSRSQQGLTEAPAQALKAGVAAATGLGLGSRGEENTQMKQSNQMIPPQANLAPDQMPPEMQQELIPSEQVQENTQSISDQFPQLLQAAQQRLEAGLSPEEVFEKLSKHVSYRGLIKRFEEKQGSFLDALYELAGGGKNQQSQGSQKKDQFMQGLSQMSQLLQNLKGR